METALAVAETVTDSSLLARVQRALMILHNGLGNTDEAREHGREAVALSEEAGDRRITFWIYWALATGEGLLGEVEVMDGHIQRCREIAKELRSPVLRLWTSEVLLEHAMAAGEWNYGIALGEQAVARARVLGQDTLLPRLLVWLSLIYLGRGEIERAKGLQRDSIPDPAESRAADTGWSSITTLCGWRPAGAEPDLSTGTEFTSTDDIKCTRG